MVTSNASKRGQREGERQRMPSKGTGKDGQTEQTARQEIWVFF